MDVKSIRLKLGLSQSEFAKLVGVTAMTVIRWETGKTAITKEHLEKVLTHLATADTICVLSVNGKKIKIMMYALDHNPPHIHVGVGSNKSLWFRVNLKSLQVMDNTSFDNKDLKEVITWISKNTQSLLKNWDQCSVGEKPAKNYEVNYDRN